MPSITHLSETRRALLEKYLRSKLAQTPENEGVIRPNESEGPIPLSFGQQQMWLLNQLTPHIPVYNECVTIHLPGPLDVDILEQSFNEIIYRHEAWRTSFPLVDGLPVQVIHSPSLIKLPVRDLRHLPKAEREAEALRLATEDAGILFNLAEGPLLRPLLIHLGDEEHRLFLTLHHIIFDGVAIYQVFLPELRALYEAFLAGQPSPLPPLPIRYSDYAAWQVKQLHSDAFADHLAYWKQQLTGTPAVLALPTDRPRLPVQSYRGSMRPFALTKRLTDALKAVSQREGVTFYMTLVAAFNTLLYRYTGQEDLLIGTATAGRNRPELQKLLGYFLNTLVLRADLSGNPTFRELLGRVREVIASAVTHEDMPFDLLVKELRPERDFSVNPFFQVLFTLEPPLPVLPSGWTLTQMDVTVGISKFDLSLELDDRPEGLIGRFEYNTDLFDAATIERMVEQWRTLLESIVSNPEQHLSDLQILTEKERQLVLVDWNSTRAPYPDHQCIHQLIEDQVERSPEAIAVVCGEGQLRYGELNERANQLASYLLQLGVGPETLVGLCMERSLEMVVGLLGILKAGGTYVPLDPAYPVERVSFMIEDAQISLLLTQQHLTTQLSSHPVRLICLDASAELLSQQSVANPRQRVTPDNLAYVIYTSGSTGRPKGVQVLHRAVVNFLTSMGQQPGLTSDDILLAVTTLSFDIAALELFLPLVVGARLIIASRDIAADGAALAEALACSRVTAMQATPVTWRILLAAGWPGNQRLKALCGGEALSLELARQLLPKCASLWNLYGPTETTIWSTVSKIEQGIEAVSIGRPIANTQVYVLDANLHPVPIGVAGELYIGGDGLARGYLNRPELTAERFMVSPFGDESGTRLYATGDLARYRPDGTIELLGRRDHQVKLRGFRIELGEIEAVLSQHPSVQQALVVVHEGSQHNKRLVAYVVCDTQQRITSDDLQSHLIKQLPTYMLPSAYVMVEALPLTPNGKVDRRALPAPEFLKQALGETYVAPTLPVHYQLVQIWEELLGVHPIGIKDNFFELGGHSLLAAFMFDRVAQVCGKRLPLYLFLTGATIEHLALALLEDKVPVVQEESRAMLVPVQTGSSKRPFFYLHGDYIYGAFYCSVLARSLGEEQPFYVLEPYKFDGLRTIPSFGEVAKAYIQSIRSVQPEGPYLLGGWCAGALMGYEIARQLRAEGQQVELLVLMDPGKATRRDRFLRAFSKRIGRMLRWEQDRELRLFMRLIYTPRYVRRGSFRQSRNAAPGSMFGPFTSNRLPKDKGFHFSKLFPPAEILRGDNEIIFEWLASGYTPYGYRDKITFFWTKEDPHRKIAWEKTVETEESELYTILGTHFTSRTDHLDVLAECLRECLNKAQAPGENERKEK